VKNYICVVQVRFESSEFPGKSLSAIGKETALEFLLRRIGSAKSLAGVVVATSTDRSDDVVEKVAAGAGVAVYRGDSGDVLERLYNAVKDRRPDGVVKVLGNAPLVDVGAMEELIRLHSKGGYDYAYNEHAKGVVFGTGCSIFSFAVLEKLALSTKLTLEQREIGSLYIRQHPEIFRILTACAEKSYPLFKVLINEMRDVDLVHSIVKYVPELSSETIGAFLEENPLLVEYQNAQSVSETGLEKLYLFPEKVDYYLKGGFDPAYPVSVELSLTNACNFDCVWCSDGDLRKRLGGEFTVSDMQKFFADLKAGGTIGVVIEGGGEPMIHKEFATIVKCAHNKGLALGLITNGSMPVEKELIHYFEWIRISLDAATPEQHSSAKKVKVFENVMRNLIAIGSEKGSTTLGVGYVVTRDNQENLENLLLRLRYYNVDYIQFRPVIDCPDLSPDSDLKYLRKYETPKFKVDINAMTANAARGNDGRPCLAHSLSCVVTADGGVYLCGRLNIYDWVKPMGNIHKNSFRDIWLGEERRRQSAEVAGVEFCKTHCPECRMTKYNLLADRIRNFKTRSFI
jgi:radical SAM protein with 4Fe4S-binding SPASM domain